MRISSLVEKTKLPPPQYLATLLFLSFGQSSKQRSFSLDFQESTTAFGWWALEKGNIWMPMWQQRATREWGKRLYQILHWSSRARSCAHSGCSKHARGKREARLSPQWTGSRCLQNANKTRYRIPALFCRFFNLSKSLALLQISCIILLPYLGGTYKNSVRRPSPG